MSKFTDVFKAPQEMLIARKLDKEAINDALTDPDVEIVYEREEVKDTDSPHGKNTRRELGRVGKHFRGDEG